MAGDGSCLVGAPCAVHLNLRHRRRIVDKAPWEARRPNCTLGRKGRNPAAEEGRAATVAALIQEFDAASVHEPYPVATRGDADDEGEAATGDAAHDSHNRQVGQWSGIGHRADQVAIGVAYNGTRSRRPL